MLAAARAPARPGALSALDPNKGGACARWPRAPRRARPANARGSQGVRARPRAAGDAEVARHRALGHPGGRQGPGGRPGERGRAGRAAGGRAAAAQRGAPAVRRLPARGPRPLPRARRACAAAQAARRTGWRRAAPVPERGRRGRLAQAPRRWSQQNACATQRARRARRRRRARPAGSSAARRARRGWGVVVTGHSLGAGAAALVALYLRNFYPETCAWAFSPPGGLVDSALAGAAAACVTSVAVGKDWVPRLSLASFERLRDDMARARAPARPPRRLPGCRCACSERSADLATHARASHRLQSWEGTLSLKSCSVFDKAARASAAGRAESATLRAHDAPCRTKQRAGALSRRRARRWWRPRAAACPRRCCCCARCWAGGGPRATYSTRTRRATRTRWPP